jgi:hypothetical protein
VTTHFRAALALAAAGVLVLVVALPLPLLLVVSGLAVPLLERWRVGTIR